ncbi:hypothetical protein [Mycobacteroides abscessus]|uniref:hypothetical protein n=1 Tax=Mycobacteroides abscessus TaxID=36809 RepID=UPI001054DA3B|nr:hypothetical protein [Mycobacteroides abscessus]
MAILAILTSAWYNRRTLRQARVLGDGTIAVTKQQRADLRYDVLRKELAQWLTMVSEVERACGELLRRLQEIDSHTEFDGSPLIEFVDVGGPSIGALHSIVGRAIAEPMTNLTTQGIQIQMLTADYTVLANVHLITQAIVGKIQNLYELLNKVSRYAKLTPDERESEDEFIMSVTFAVAQDYQYTRQIRVSRSDLMAHIIQRFNPAAVEALARVHREYPDVIGGLQPTNIWGPPQPQSQPSATQPADENTEPPTAPRINNETDSD